MAQQNATIPRLPSPLSVFQAEPGAERMLRIIAIERELGERYGAHHCPVRLSSGEYDIAYFAVAFDAELQRRRLARAIVELEERAAKYHTTPEFEAKVAELPTCSCGRPLIGGRDLCPRCDVGAVA